MALSFDFRDQLNGPWESARTFVIEQLDQLISGVNATFTTQSTSITTNSPVYQDAIGSQALSSVFTTSGGGTWTINTQNRPIYRYCLNGKQMHVRLGLQGTTDGNAATLIVKLPSKVIAIPVDFPLWGIVQTQDNTGAILTAWAEVINNPYYAIAITRTDGAKWPVGSLSIGGGILFEVS